MQNHMLVATRKGLFEYQRIAGHWQVCKRSFLGDPVNFALDCESHRYAALHLGHFGAKLHRSDDAGHSWKEVAVPTLPKRDNADRDSAAAKGDSINMIWTLEQDSQGTLWAGTIPAALFKSTDYGESWQLNEALWAQPSRSEWFGGGFDEAGIHSICIDPRNVDWITIAISCGGVWQSRDGGASWHCTSEGLVADYMPPEQQHNPVAQDPHRIVQCQQQPDCFWMQHHNGIFYSNDNCQSWQRATPQPSAFGFAVAVDPNNAKRAWFIPAIKDEKRYPVDAKLQANRTEDGGETFANYSAGLPMEESYDLIYRHALALDDSGQWLAMGSTTGNLWLSHADSQQWQLISNYLPPVYAINFCHRVK